MFHAARDLIRERDQLLLGEDLLLLVAAEANAADQVLVVGSAEAVTPQEVLEVAVRGVLHDYVQWAVLAAAAEQVDDVDVLANHLHHLHLADQVLDVGVRVTLCKKLPL